MADLKEAIAKVKGYEKTKKIWRTQHNSIEFQEASRLNQALFQMPLNHASNCQCIEDLFYYINNVTNEKLTKKQQQTMNKFKLKEGIVLTLHAFNEAFTNSNMTDDKAVEILAKYPGHIVSFEIVPKDWKEQVEKFKKSGGKGKGNKVSEDSEFDALVEVCKDKGYPKEEWEHFGKEALTAYVNEKALEDSEGNEEGKALKEKLTALKLKKKAELVKIVQGNKVTYPAAEWEMLTRDELAVYIAGK